MQFARYQNTSTSNIISTTSLPSTPIRNNGFKTLSFHGVISSLQPSAVEFVAGEKEATQFTPIVTQSTMSDPTYITWTDSTGGTWGAYWLPWGIGSEPDDLSSVDNVFPVDMNSASYGTFEVRTVTINDADEIDNGEMFRLYYPGGNIVVWFNTAGSPQTVPTGSVYTNATTTIMVDISSIGSGSPVTNVAEAVEAACEANSAFNTYFTVDNAAGVLTFTNKHIGNATATAVYDADSTSLSPYGSPEQYAFSTTTTVAGSVADTVDAMIDAFIAAANDNVGGSPNAYFTIVANAGAGSPDQAESFTITNKDESAVTNATSSGSPQDFTISVTNEGVSGVDPDDDTITKASHGLTTGQVVQLTTTGSLPTGLSLSTDYYVIRVDANNFQFATTLANATAGTAIDITDGGSGTHTVTAESIDITATLQASNDESNWVAVSGATQAIDNPASNADDFLWSVTDPAAKYYRVNFVVTAGYISTTLISIGSK